MLQFLNFVEKIINELDKIFRNETITSIMKNLFQNGKEKQN